MAQRYGGQHSPTPTSDPRRAPRPIAAPRGMRRANMLFIPAGIALMTNLTAGPVSMITGIAGFVGFTVAALLLRGGLEAEAEYDARSMAKRPALPRKILAAGATGLSVAVLSMTGDAGLISGPIYGLGAAALQLIAFGIDPLRDKHIAGVDEFQQDRVARVVDEAEEYLSEIDARVKGLRDRALHRQVQDFIYSAREMIDRVEADPRDLTQARKFLGVYLRGARDATVKFVGLWETSGRAHARDEYLGLLGDLETNFAAKTERLLISDRTDVDVEIKVLRDRLNREGLQAEHKEY